MLMETDPGHPEASDPCPLRRPGQGCRVCGGAVAEGAATAPFCSERCRLVDLGRWFSGDYRISRQAKESDVEASD